MMRHGSLSLLQWSLMLTRGAGSPLPSITDDEAHQPHKRSLIGGGPLEDWEIAIIILGALFGVMLLGFVGGICEVVLAGRIKESNAEADAKLEANANRDIGEEAEDGKGGEGMKEVIDQDRYSWQPERMTTGLSDDSTLAGSDRGVLESGGEQAMNEGGDWYGDSGAAQQGGEPSMPWTSEGLPPPDTSQFVMDDVDSPGYGSSRDNAQSYEAYPGHLNPPPAMPTNDNAVRDQDTGDQYWENGTSGAGSYQAEYEGSPDDHAAHATMAPPGAYSGEGYSPAVMPDSADYLQEYRQSQLYLQQDDDWYASASATYGAPEGTAR